MSHKVLVRISEFSDLAPYYSLSQRLFHTHRPAPTLPGRSVGHTLVLMFCSSSWPCLGHSDSRFHYGLFSCLFSCITSSYLLSEVFKDFTWSKCLARRCCSSTGPPLWLFINSRLVSRVRSPHSANKDIQSNTQKEVTPNRKEKKNSTYLIRHQQELGKDEWKWTLKAGGRVGNWTINFDR